MSAIAEIEVITRFVNWRSWLFVMVTTDEGLVGWGEGSTSDRSEAVAGAIGHFTPRLLGRDSEHIELIWRDLFTGWRGGPIVNSAIAAVDGALWDLKGKRYGVPVWKLLGGPIRRRVRVYAGGISRWLDSVDSHRQGTAEVIAAGYMGAKVTPFGPSGELTEMGSIAFAIELIGAMRVEAGPDFEIFIECAERLTPRLAIEAAAALAEFRRSGWKSRFLPTTSRRCASWHHAWPYPSPAVKSCSAGTISVSYWRVVERRSSNRI